MPRTQYRPRRRPLVPAGMGQKNNDRIRVRNRHFKIKKVYVSTKGY